MSVYKISHYFTTILMKNLIEELAIELLNQTGILLSVQYCNIGLEKTLNLYDKEDWRRCRIAESVNQVNKLN